MLWGILWKDPLVFTQVVDHKQLLKKTIKLREEYLLFKDGVCWKQAE